MYSESYLHGTVPIQDLRANKRERDLIEALFHLSRVKKDRVLWQAQKGFCYICDEPMKGPDANSNDQERMSLDHLIPKSAHGHKTSIFNLALCHQGCNSKRSSEPLTIEQQKKVFLIHGSIFGIITAVPYTSPAFRTFSGPPPWKLRDVYTVD